MRCLNCDYLLKNLTEHRCPECGTPFNPRDPTTFKITTPFVPPPVSVVIFVGVVVVVFLLIPVVNDGARVLAWSYAAVFALVMALMVYMRFRTHRPQS